MADTLVLGTSAVRREGSNPFSGTHFSLFTYIKNPLITISPIAKQTQVVV